MAVNMQEEIMNILAIDPGNIESAYVVLDSNLKPVEFGKISNEEMLDTINAACFNGKIKHIAIEMIASYGMAVGESVFQTCVWIGKFAQEASKYAEVTYIYRKDEKMNLCHTMKAKDSNIRQALIDRFGIVGVKKNPGWFYGFKSDVWAAYAVGVTYYDLHLRDI